ncbi:DUF805 domain-containing protein [Leifsonia sp. P73]|uniref:DUF805 domain-containing protein n=1 Tax=Leifsonia sp. P73 TaxID=3423959 RepID=UPI003DA2D8F8
MITPESQAQPHVPLWAPYYRAPFGEAFVRYWKKYARFDGRASRSEYWWWALIDALIVLALYAIVLTGAFVGSSRDSEGSLIPGPGIAVGIILLAAWWLGTVIPGLALAARRLHDVDLSGLLLLLLLIPSLGGFAVFVMTLLPPNPRGARFDRPDGEVPGYEVLVPGAGFPPRDYGWPQTPLPYAGPAGGQPLYAAPRPAEKPSGEPPAPPQPPVEPDAKPPSPPPSQPPTS